MLSETLLKIFKTEAIESPCDALALILHTFMLETGFIPKDLQDSKQYEYMPQQWKSSGVYKIHYYHKLCPDVTCWMTCIPISSLITIQGTVDTIQLDRNINISLKQDDYLSKTKEFSDPIAVYQHVDELSRLFKDEFCYSLLSCIQNYVGYKPVFGLSGLLDDLKFHIMTLLPVESVVAISAVNNEFHQLAKFEILWKFLFLKDFYKDGVPDSVLVTTDTTNWKELYVAEYSRRNLRKRRPRVLRNIPFVSDHLITHIDEDDDIDLSIDLDPAIQQAFPYLRRRFQPRHPIIDYMNSKGRSPFFRFN